MLSAPLAPSYYGYVGSTKDALHIIQAAVDKQVDLILRRPHERERPGLIRSGNVFVFIEEHSGIKRWTDGIAWLPSRILGRFLVYRELDKHLLAEVDDKRKKKRKMLLAQDPLEKRHFAAHDAPGYDFKDQGLIKKTLSLSTVLKELHVDRRPAKQTIHLILYYSADDVLNGRLQRPSEAEHSATHISAGLWDAIKELLLGGKIPLEDEAYYFLDTNYQLQNMLVLQGYAPALAPAVAKHPPFPVPVQPALHAKDEPQDDQHPYAPQELAFTNPFTANTHANVGHPYQQYGPQDGFMAPHTLPPRPGPVHHHFAPFPPQHFQQMYQQQQAHFGLMLASSDQFLVSGASNGLFSSVGSGAVHAGSIALSTNSFSGPSMAFKYRNNSGGGSGWYQTGSGAGYASRLPALPHEGQDAHHHLPTPDESVSHLYMAGAGYHAT